MSERRKMSISEFRRGLSWANLLKGGPIDITHHDHVVAVLTPVPQNFDPERYEPAVDDFGNQYLAPRSRG